jgi:hypothetical protein
MFLLNDPISHPGSQDPSDNSVLLIMCKLPTLCCDSKLSYISFSSDIYSLNLVHRPVPIHLVLHSCPWAQMLLIWIVIASLVTGAQNNAVY